MSSEENNTAIIASRYYPTISSLINEDDIPDMLGFIKDGIVYLFDNIHYKDLQFSKSVYGDEAFYSLSIVTKKRLDIEIPGTGIYLVLNPNVDSSQISAFPITVEYQWKILGYISRFNLNEFSFIPKDIFETALQALNISEEKAILQFINEFVDPIEEDIEQIHQFVNDVKMVYPDWTYTLPADTTNAIPEILQSLQGHTGEYSSLIAFGIYILNSDFETTKRKLNTYFKSLLSQNIEKYIKDIVTPKARATLLLSAAIEFPRSILKPVYNEFGEYPGVEPSSSEPPTVEPLTGEPLTELPEEEGGNPKVMLSFGQALFYADTEEGFGYNLDVVLNTNYPAQIGNTGLIVDIQNLKIDLSRNSNIIEADLDNRPPEFMGIYTDVTTIYLPKKWFKKDTGQTLAITGERLLIGTGGMSGTIALRATYAVQQSGEVTDYFSEYFQIDYGTVVKVVSNGSEEIIADQAALLTHINGLNSPYALRFAYPLTILTNTGATTFQKEAEYNAFISAIDPNQFMWFQLGKNEERAWRLGFNRFDLTFHHGSVVESNLKARLEIPKFKDPDNPDETAIINLEGHWYSEEDFSLTASFLPGGFPLNLFNFMTINFLSAEIGKDDDNFFIGTACEIWFDNEIMNRILDGQKIVLPHLRMYDNGSIEIVGGNGFIPTNISLNLGPIEIAVSGIHFGSHQREHNGVMRKYDYWGFDGAINLDPLGFDARGEGVKYYYTVDNDEHGDNGHSYLHIKTIEIDLIIPGNEDPDNALAIIHGMLTIPEPGESQEYIGEVSVQLPQAKIAGGNAAMRLQPKHPAFLIEAGIDMAKPIPLAATGIGFFAFGGLLGYNYVAEKEAIGLVSGENTWYEYFVHPERGVNQMKFSGPEREHNMPFSVGAGTVLGTMFDDGYTFSTRLMAILSLPSVFILDGRANVLGERIAMLDHSEPPFFAGVAFGDNSLEFWFGADYQLPSNGFIIDLYAEVQAGFFFNNPSAWYINFGTKENPISARFLTVLTAQSFLMLSAQGIEAGARVEFDLRRNFFGIKVHLYAYVEAGGAISFERPQFGGYIAMGGQISISFWKIVGFTIGLDAILSGEAAEPFLLYAELRLRICIRIIVKICKRVTVKLKWGGDNEPNRTPIPPLPFAGNPLAPLPIGGNNHVDRTEQSVKGIHMLTNEAFDVDFLGVIDNDGELEIFPNSITKIIPVDTFIDFKVMKGLLPGAVSGLIGGYNNAPTNHVDLIPPQRVVRGGRELRQVKHKYSIESIEINALNRNGEWESYHPFQAVVKPEDGIGDVSHLRIGYWQKSSKQYNTVRLLATNPFSYLTAGEPGWFIPEQMGIGPSDLFCETQQRGLDCMNFLTNNVGTTYYPPTQYEAHDINGVQFNLVGVYFGEADDEGSLIPVSDDNFRISNASNSHGYTKSLEFDNYNSLEILTPEPSVRVDLLLNTHAQGVTIRYYKSVLNDTSPNAIYQQIGLQTKAANELQNAVSYVNEEAFISKIVISPNTPNSDDINAIELQIEELWLEAYNNAVGEDVVILTAAQEQQLDIWDAELAALKGEACSLPVRNYYFVNTYEEAVSKVTIQIPDLHKSGIHYYANGNFTKNPTELDSRVLMKLTDQGEILNSSMITDRNAVAISGDDLIATNEGWLDYKFVTQGGNIFNLQVTNFTNDLEVVWNKDVKYDILVEDITKFPSAYMKELNSRYTIFSYANHKDATISLTLFDGQGTAVHFGSSDSIPVDSRTIIHKISPLVDTVGASILVETADTFYLLDFRIDSSRIIASSVYELSVKSVFDIHNIKGDKLLITAEIGSKNCITIARRLETNLEFTSTQFSNEIKFKNLNFIEGYHDNDEVFVRNTQYIFKVKLSESSSHIITSSWVLSDLRNLIQHIRYNTIEKHFVVSCMIDETTDISETYTGIVKSDFNSCIFNSYAVSHGFTNLEFSSMELERRSKNEEYEVIEGEKSQAGVNLLKEEICPVTFDDIAPSKCFTTLQEICWMTLENHEFNIAIPSQAAIVEDQLAMEEAIEKIVQPVWRPNTKYYVKFTLKDEVDNGESTPGVYNYYYGFKTVGPVGHFQHHPEVNYIAEGENPDQYPITSLRQYIDYNRSYPNADGSLLQAKPIFYGANQCKINLFFDKQWAYHMLNTWAEYNNMDELQGALNIAIKDPVTDVIIPYPLPEEISANETVPVPENESWDSDTDPNIPAGILLLNNLINHINQHSSVINCNLEIGDPLSPAGYTYEVTLTKLKPQKLYTALFYNAFEVNNDDLLENKEIHQYVFQTSRYKDFSEQVKSYLLNDGQDNEKPAIFDVSITATAEEVMTAYNIVAGENDEQSNALETQYQHHFDRVLEGVLSFKPLDPPSTTEFNVIVNKTDGKTIGLLIRNPEPFNIPKIPLDTIQNTIVVVNSEGEIMEDYKVLHAKDYSQALIMHSSGQIEASTISLRFIYKTWDGNSRQYTIADTVTIQELQIQ
ncbi:hypothetical protein [uncultured Kordia sp.]|uniref:hypothetical protein n=1 Tax=uncultured Kordia sp. TaxID=507699 RepID=UPI00261EF821|nr:hypothetical protein [uncultured Kordia sp.]